MIYEKTCKNEIIQYVFPSPIIPSLYESFCNRPMTKLYYSNGHCRKVKDVTGSINDLKKRGYHALQEG